MLLGGTHPFWIWTWSYKLDMYNGVFTIGLWGSYHQPVNIQVWMLLYVFFCFFQLIKEPGMITYAIVWFFYSDCSCNNLTLFKLGPIYVVIVDTYSWYLFPSLEMPLQGWVKSILLPIFIVYKCAWYSLKTSKIFANSFHHWVKLSCFIFSRTNWCGIVDQFHKSQNAPVPYPTMLDSEKKCGHFCFEWSIVGYGTGAFLDLWIKSCFQLDTDSM